MNILLHPGYPKTGTTTLQCHLFEPSDKFQCLARPEVNERWGEFAFFPRSVIAEDTHMFCESFSKLINYVENKITQESSGVAVFSEEGLLNFNAGTEDFRLRGQNKIGLTASRMKEIFDAVPNVDKIKVLITIRNQFDLLLSFYTHFFYQFYRGSLFENSFDKFIDYNLKSPNLGILATLYYDKVIKLYQNIYGEANVLILPLEMLEYDKEDFIALLQEFCELPESAFETLAQHSPQRNRSKKTDLGEYIARTTLYNALALRQIRVLHTFPNLVNRLPHSIKLFFQTIKLQTKIIHNKSQKEAIGRLYSDTNRELQKITGLELEQYGYAL